MQEVVQHANRGGYVMGICNGFQILTEAGLFPGALLRNVNQKFICDNIYIKPVTNSLLLTNQPDQNKAYKIPIAHGDKDTLRRLEDNSQIMFKYSSNIADTHEICNMNGSLLSIAGISNEKKKVSGNFRIDHAGSKRLVEYKPYLKAHLLRCTDGLLHYLKYTLHWQQAGKAAGLF